MLVLLVAACHKGPDPGAFPDGLEPLDVPGAPDWPDDDSLSLETGMEDGLGWGMGRTRFAFPIGTVRDAFASPDAVVDRREVDSWTVEPGDDAYPVSFVIHNETSQLGLTVAFDIAWRMGAVAGTEADPTEVVARFEKIDGTEFIDVLQGSVWLRDDGQGETRVELVEQLDATLGGEDERVGAYLSDLHASIRAVLDGEGLPTWE